MFIIFLIHFLNKKIPRLSGILVEMRSDFNLETDLLIDFSFYLLYVN